jgi:hypothetical protein
MQECMYQKTIFLNSVEFCQFNKPKNYSYILFMKCLTGHVLRLQYAHRLEITGRFEHKIMPGKYEVSWRMNSESNI